MRTYLSRLFGSIALVLVPHTVFANCSTLGGSIVAGVCTVSSAVTRQGTFSLSESLHVTATGSIRVSEGQELYLDIVGDLIIDTPIGMGGRIVGDSTTPTRFGADISITTSDNILLQANARITSEANANGKAQSSCFTSRGGTIRLNARGDMTTMKGSLISTSSKCTAGEIDILVAGVANMGGQVLAQSLLTGVPWGYPGGGPISINAGSVLAVQSTGIISSKGIDQGADLVHLAGGCEVNIFGLVQSTGPGHVVPTNPPNRCNLNDRPHSTAIAPMACVEIWSGGTLLIDRTGTRKGEINADTGQSGGTRIAWIDAFAAGDISILGHSTKYAVHANQFLTNGSGGLVTVKSIYRMVKTSYAAVQTNDTASGGIGGVITIEAARAFTLGNALIQAKGGAKGYRPVGGVIAGRSFNGHLTGVPPGSLDARGGTPTTGAIILQSCLGTNYTGATLPTSTLLPSQCGGTPILPSYVILPTCLQPQPYCGDGTVNQANEQCDDGNMMNGDGCSAFCEIENKAPDCSIASADPDLLWPPNHQEVSISIIGVTDSDGDPLTIAATAVYQDEDVKSEGSGNFSPDATLVPLTVRSERDGDSQHSGNGRVYHISFTADDGNGGMCTGEVKVCVPHDQGGSSSCIDGGSLYNSLVVMP